MLSHNRKFSSALLLRQLPGQDRLVLTAKALLHVQFDTKTITVAIPHCERG